MKIFIFSIDHTVHDLLQLYTHCGKIDVYVSVKWHVKFNWLNIIGKKLFSFEGQVQFSFCFTTCQPHWPNMFGHKHTARLCFHRSDVI